MIGIGVSGSNDQHYFINDLLGQRIQLHNNNIIIKN